MRTVTLIRAHSGRPPSEAIEQLERADLSPRQTLFEKTLGSEILDERFIGKLDGTLGAVCRALPVSAGQILAGYALRDRYDAVISWADHLGIPLAGLFKATAVDVPHIGIFSWVSRRKKAVALRMVHSHFDKIILMSSAQHQAARNDIGVPEDKLLLLRWPVDQLFWRPQMHGGDRICAVGREMRDYATLLEALRGTGIPCHIAANVVPGKPDPWITVLQDPSRLPPNVSTGRKSYAELRELYAASRFVVIPLFPTDTDNGTTSILEAMAVGKAVICSRVAGQRDVLVDGVTGIFVPPGDADALRREIVALWSDPARAEAMGREGRRVVERDHTLDAWLASVFEAVSGAIRRKKG